MKYLFLVLPLFYSTIQAVEHSELSSLSLEELFNIKVSVTSKRDENQHFAPGVISVISSQEIQQYGARNLRDVIDRIVGAQVVGSHQRPHNKTSIRGMNGAHQEGWELLLLNGRPIHDGTDGGFNFDIYQGFPLEMIDHIEIIRGPGSVIYGTNAMSGAINIITKDSKKSVNENRIDISMGSFNRNQLQLTTLLGNADYSLNIGLNAIRANGDSVDGVVDAYDVAGAYDMGEKSDNLVFNGQYKGFTINGMLMNSDSDSFGSKFHVPSSTMQKKRQYLDLGYTYDITADWDVSLNYTINTGEFDWEISNSGTKNHYDDQYDMLEMLIRGSIANNFNVLLGVNSSNYESKFKSGLLDASINNKSAYLQMDYMLSASQKIIGGVQLNKPEDTEEDLSSRLGYVSALGDSVWFKLLYSEAYRSPNLQEAKIDATTLKGNPLLDPEKVATYDAQLIYQKSKYYFALSVYDTMLRNVISRYIVDIDGQDTTKFRNEGHIHYQGLEFEGRAYIGDDVSIIGNFSYQKNKTDSGMEDSTFAPNIMAKVGVTYEGIYGMNMSTFNSYIGESTDLTLTNSAVLRNPKADAYNLLTMNISIDTGKMWNIGKEGHSLITLYLDNLLDEGIYSPDLDYTKGSNTIPSHWGRSANLTYTYKF